MPSRLRFVLSQLGPKRHGAESQQRLVDVTDLPGPAWAIVDRRTWRTGHQTPRQPWAERAAAAGSVTAWRSFRSQDRWLWVQLAPLADASDSELALRSVPGGLLANLRSQHTVEAQGEVSTVHVPGADAVWAYEQHTRNGSITGISLLLAVTSGSHLVAMGASGQPDWTWAELIDIAGRQLARLPAP